MPKTSKLAKRTAARKVLEGLSKRFAPNSKLVVAGRTYTAAQLAARIRRQIDALDEVDRLTSALRQAVRDEEVVALEVSDLIAQLKLLTLVAHGRNAQVLGDFGWVPPRRPGPKTSEARANQVQRARVTREARKRPT